MQLSLTQLPIQVWIVLIVCVVGLFWLKRRAAGTPSLSPRRSARSLYASSDRYGYYRYPEQKRSGGFELVFLILALIVVLYFAWLMLSKSVHIPSLQGVTQQVTCESASGCIVGGPTVTADFIDTVLAQAKSPAQGLGPTLYSLGVKYDINPADALAFFHHESGYGTQGVARYTHSIGNIKCTPGWQCFDGFRSYPSWEAGAADWYKLIHDVYLSAGRDTVAKIIPVYAPGKDHNNEGSYIQAVLADVARWKQGQV